MASCRSTQHPRGASPSSARTPRSRRSWAAARRSSTRTTASAPGTDWPPRSAKTRLIFAAGCTNLRFEPLLTGAFTVDFFDSGDLSGPVAYRETVSEAQAFWFGAVGGGKVDPAQLFGPAHRHASCPK